MMVQDAAMGHFGGIGNTPSRSLTGSRFDPESQPTRPLPPARTFLGWLA